MIDACAEKYQIKSEHQKAAHQVRVARNKLVHHLGANYAPTIDFNTAYNLMKTFVNRLS